MLALDRLSLRRLAAGQVTALLGPNGAGKSAAVGVLTGRLAAYAHRDAAVRRRPARGRTRTQSGVTLQERACPAPLPSRNRSTSSAATIPRPGRERRCRGWRGWQGQEARRCHALSGGQQGRLKFALAIAGRPDLLTLNEPSTGVDVEARRTPAGGGGGARPCS